MDNQPATHKSILKSTGVFSLVKIFKILSSILTNKVAAIYLGPAGVGTLGLIKSTLALIGSVTDFGFSITGVKEVAKHNNEEATKIDTTLPHTIAILRWYTICISCVGVLVTILFSKKLSLLFFKTENYYWWIIALSFNFFLVNYNLFLNAILQGLRKMKSIAWSGIISAFLMAVATIPCYYFLEQNGIIPSILLTNLLGTLVVFYYVKKLSLPIPKIDFKTFWSKAKDLYQLGFLLSINVIFGFINKFLIKIYLEKYGATEATLGYYEASLVIFHSYFGIIFAAMVVDYYPKLTSIITNNLKVKKLVNKQIEVGLLLVTPLVTLLYALSRVALTLLYSKEFQLVEDILLFGLLSIVIKAITLPIGFVLLAKNNKRAYFLQELASNILTIILSLSLHHYLDLIGLGLATFLIYAISITYMFGYIYKYYNFSFNKEVLQVFSVCFTLSVISCGIFYYAEGIVKVITFVVINISTITYCVYYLNKKTEMIPSLRKKLNL